MTNLLTRLKETILADLNSALDQKESQNPIALLNQYLRQCEQETEKVDKLVKRQSQLKDEFTRERNQAAELAEKRKYQTEIALKAGETELYEFALAEQQHYSERAQRLTASLTQVTEQLSDLERKYQEMKHKLKDMQLRRLELMGRENVTHANQRISQVLESNSYSKSYSKFKDIETYLDRLKQKVNEPYYRHTIDVRIAELEKQFDTKENHFVNITKD